MNFRFEKVYCAFCRIERRVCTKRHINWTNILLAALVSLGIMMIFWQQFDFRVEIIFVLCLAISEVFIQVRWRLNIVCPHCGFDPVLYIKDHEKAAAKVKATLDTKKSDPSLLLRAKNPFQTLPKNIKKTRSSSRWLSKQV